MLSAQCSGSTNDCVAWELTSLAQYIRSGSFNSHYSTVCDEALSCTEVTLTPYGGQRLGIAKDSFNYHHLSCLEPDVLQLYTAEPTVGKPTCYPSRDGPKRGRRRIENLFIFSPLSPPFSDAAVGTAQHKREYTMTDVLLQLADDLSRGIIFPHSGYFGHTHPALLRGEFDP
jgi:hypothetical protein